MENDDDEIYCYILGFRGFNMLSWVVASVCVSLQKKEVKATHGFFQCACLLFLFQKTQAFFPIFFCSPFFLLSTEGHVNTSIDTRNLLDDSDWIVGYCTKKTCNIIHIGHVSIFTGPSDETVYFWVGGSWPLWSTGEKIRGAWMKVTSGFWCRCDDRGKDVFSFSEDEKSAKADLVPPTCLPLTSSFQWWV